MSLFRTSRALNRLSDRMETITDRLTDLERTSRKLDLEFTELYDKVSHQMGRMAKRYASRNRSAEDSLNANLEDSQPVATDPISQSIMLRRAGVGRDK